jgi:hypothetical protein
MRGLEDFVMMGTQTAPAQLFYDFDLERHVPSGHMLREIDRFLDVDGMREAVRPFYSHMGRPSIDPELIIRMLVIGQAERMNRTIKDATVKRTTTTDTTSCGRTLPTSLPPAISLAGSRR